VMIVHPLHCFSLWNGCSERLEDRRAGLERNEFDFVPAHPAFAFKIAKPNYHLHTHTQNAPHVNICEAAMTFVNVKLVRRFRKDDGHNTAKDADCEPSPLHVQRVS
jgi:hypothetical protein